MIIPIAMISDDNYIMQTSVAIASLKANKNKDTRYEINIIMAECTDESHKKLLSMNSEDVLINIVDASLEKYRDIKQVSHVPIACLLKFEVSDILSQYDKILYLDGDIIVRSDLSDLYNTDLTDYYAAAVKEIYYINDDEEKTNVNAGIMLFNSARIRNENIKEILIENRKKLGDRGSMDQQTYNMVLKGKFRYIDIKYNCVPGRFSGDTKLDCTIGQVNDLYNSEYKDFNDVVEKAVIIHFATGNKPWKYTFAPCAKEWYSYYLKSPYKDQKIKMYGRWGYRFHKLSEICKKEGLSGVISYIGKRSDRKVKKKVSWD